LPDASAVATAEAAPLKDTVAPAPPATGLMVPDMLQTTVDCPVKLTAVWLAPLIVTGWLVGVKVNPLLLGVTV